MYKIKTHILILLGIPFIAQSLSAAPLERYAVPQISHKMIQPVYETKSVLNNEDEAFRKKAKKLTVRDKKNCGKRGFCIYTPAQMVEGHIWPQRTPACAEATSGRQRTQSNTSIFFVFLSKFDNIARAGFDAGAACRTFIIHHLGQVCDRIHMDGIECAYNDAVS